MEEYNLNISLFILDKKSLVLYNIKLVEELRHTVYKGRVLGLEENRF